MTGHNQDVTFWQNQLKQQRENLRQLRSQQSNYAKGDERLALLNQILAAEQAIREAKVKLRHLGEQPEPSTVDPPEVFKSFPEHIVKQYPYPIAQACAAFNQEDSLTRRFVALDRLMVHLIKYLAGIFIGQVRCDKPSEYPLPDKLDWAATPTLESWTDALSELSQIYQQSPWKEKWQLDGLQEACTHRLLGRSEIVEAIDYLTIQLDRQGIDEPSVIDFLQLIAWYCGQEWEDAAAQYPEDRIEPLVLRLQPALVVLLNELECLRRYPLVYIEWVQISDNEIRLRPVKFMGQFTEEIAPSRKPPIIVSPKDVPAIKPKRLYIANDDGIPQLSLHPFFVIHRWELYQLRNHRLSDYIEFRSCSRGTTFRPPPEATNFYTSWSRGEIEQVPPEEVPPIVGDDEDWLDKVEPIPSDQIAEAIPLTWLNPEGRAALEIALGEALRIGRFWLGVEFLLMGLSKQSGGIFPRLLQEMGIHPGEFRGLLRGVVGVVGDRDWRRENVATLGAEALPQVRVADPSQLRQNYEADRMQIPVISPRMLAILEEAVILAGEGQIGHAHLLWALFKHPHSLAMQLFLSMAYQADWSPDQILGRLAELGDVKPEDLGDAKDIPHFPDVLPPRPGRPGQSRRPPARGGSILTEFGRDLTQEAQAGKLHPAEGETARKTMTQIGRILLQREANNPILVGDSGVGKTAIVEGFAWRLAGEGKKVNKKLAGRRVVELSVNTLTAGTKYRGDLEERLQQLLAEVKAADGRIIVFIDEIHSILESGSASGVADAIKPALARGEFPCIGATTVAEYRQHIEKDAALARRFTPVWLEEPTLEEAVEIAAKVATGHLAEYHDVTFVPEAIEAAVRLSARYLHDERLPGKAIKVLDQAASGLIMPGSLSGGLEDDEASMVWGQVTAEAVVEILAERTNIPIEQLGKTDKQRLLELESRLKARVIGQDEAVAQVVRVVKRAGAGLTDPRRPQGVFLFAGPTGVGKTELALALTEALFDREEAIFRLDMSEFMEKHQVARLTGAPPGYVGYEAEGQLTGHLRRHPYSVVLLDEIEKAHQDVQHLFLQLFDTGRLMDAQGRIADGRNAIFIMTTNLGAKEALGFVGVASSYQEKLKTAIHDHFTLEFINRIDRIVYFNPLDEESLMKIFDLEFAPFQRQLMVEKGIEVTVAPNAKHQIVQQFARQLLGARPLRRFIEDQIVAPLVDRLLEDEVEPGTKITIRQEQLNLDVGPPPPKIELPDVDLGGLGQPPLQQPSVPKRPSSPEEGLPPLDNVDDEHQSAFDELFLELARRVADQDIVLEIDSLAKYFLCAPNAEDLKPRQRRSIEQAFVELIEEPLTDELLAEKYKAGDWIKIDYSQDKVVFNRMGAEQ